MKCRKTITTPFVSRSFQLRPKVAARKGDLVPLTRPKRAKLSQPRKINVRPLPEATERWLANHKKAEDVAGTTTSLAPAPSQPMDTPSTPSPTSPIPPLKFTEYTKYCAICTPLGKICSKEFPMSSDWKNDDEEEEGKGQNKGEDQKHREKKTSQTSPRFFVTTTSAP